MKMLVFQLMVRRGNRIKEKEDWQEENTLKMEEQWT